MGSGRHYFGDEKHDYAFVVRDGMRPHVWNAVVYNRGGGDFGKLKDAKAFVEETLLKGAGK
jgi:hypothetical protein